MDHETCSKLLNAGWELGLAADRMSKAGDDDGATVVSDALAVIADLLERHENRAQA